MEDFQVVAAQRLELAAAHVRSNVIFLRRG